MLRASITIAAALLLPLSFAHAEGPNLQDPKVKALVDELVVANHILYNQGVVDGFGHISARSPLDPTHFFMSRSVAPSAVTAADIMEFDADGAVVGGDKRAPYAERFIHSEVYKARADVTSVVHGHSPSVIPYGVSHVPLRPVFHMSGFLGKGTPIFEIRDAAGLEPDTDMLVKTPRLGTGLAQALGKSSVVLMRGHGFTAARKTLIAVVRLCVFLPRNARVLLAAMQLGGPINGLSAGEVDAKISAYESDDSGMWRGWEYFAARAGCADLLSRAQGR
jgi:HCOMODA/2-hydroxy-3-carboxy-muconic semialdehyde decarboxylase